MNFKPELLAKVLTRQKTQTRRPMKPGQHLIVDYTEGDCVVDGKGRKVYQIAKDYAVCPGRGKHQQGRVVLTWINCEDVRTISIESVHAEGFQDHWEFFEVWCGFYDKAVLKAQEKARVANEPFDLQSFLDTRPDHLYQAWALTFALLEPEPVNAV